MRLGDTVIHIWDNVKKTWTCTECKHVSSDPCHCSCNTTCHSRR